MPLEINQSCIKRISVLIAAVLCAGMFSACTRSDRQPAGPLEKIRIAYAESSDSALAQIAQVQGYYLQEGLEAIPQKYPYGKVALQAVLEDRADFATVAETPVMFAVMKGANIAVIATILTTNRNCVVIARKDKGILAPSDLKHRKIATTFGTISEFFMDSFLLAQGISRKDMTVVNLQPDKMQEALATGVVDAVSAFSPYTVNIRKSLGDREITFFNEDIYTQTFNVVATREYISKNPENVRKVLRALVEAEEFARLEPAKAQQITADFCRIDKAVIHALWESENFNVSLDQVLVLSLEDESRWAIKNKLVPGAKVPNFLEFIYVDGLAAVQPQAVGLIR